MSKQALEELVITTALRYHVQIELAPDRAHLADKFRVVAENGAALAINVFEGSMHMRTDEAEIHDGKSRVVVVEEDAKLLVLSKDGQETLRVPLALSPTGVNIVRP